MNNKELCRRHLLVQNDMVGAHGFGFVNDDHFRIVSGFHIDLQLHLHIASNTAFINFVAIDVGFKGIWTLN